MRGGTARRRGQVAGGAKTGRAAALLGLGGIALALACGAASPARAQNSNAGTCTVMCDSQCSAQFSNHGSYNPIPACISRCVQQCVQGGNGGGGARSSYGSVYVTNDGSGNYGYSFGWNNQYDAMSEAQKHCRERAGGANA